MDVATPAEVDRLRQQVDELTRMKDEVEWRFGKKWSDWFGAEMPVGDEWDHATAREAVSVFQEQLAIIREQDHIDYCIREEGAWDEAYDAGMRFEESEMECLTREVLVLEEDKGECDSEKDYVAETQTQRVASVVSPVDSDNVIPETQTQSQLANQLASDARILAYRAARTGTISGAPKKLPVSKGASCIIDFFPKSSQISCVSSIGPWSDENPRTKMDFFTSGQISCVSSIGSWIDAKARTESAEPRTRTAETRTNTAQSGWIWIRHDSTFDF
jgi:hypothetical protein